MAFGCFLNVFVCVVYCFFVSGYVSLLDSLQDVFRYILTSETKF